jgi:hypothetical protein
MTGIDKEIKIKNDTTASDYITVGDTVNGKTITEIWCTSEGNVMFCLDNNHDGYVNFSELLDKMSKPDPFYDDYEYKSVTSGR